MKCAYVIQSLYYYLLWKHCVKLFQYQNLGISIKNADINVVKSLYYLYVKRISLCMYAVRQNPKEIKRKWKWEAMDTKLPYLSPS